MQKIILILVVVLLAFSCGSKKQEPAELKLVKKYIQALNQSDYSTVISLFKDSVRMNELVYKSTFSKQQYYSLFQWDSVFKPTYTIEEIQWMDGYVEMKVAKKCERILFLNEEPIVTKEQVYFDEKGIKSVDIIEYIIFNDELWNTNREKLVTWTANNHPDIDGFLYDQSLEGGLKFKEAIYRFQKIDTVQN
ncbi:hypothetical protein M3P19_12350 [Muricauda sp. 2012CJ35-5]|uniref:SnoaL-like domain-containing protein n=1 Tax=Flagellimonas spongiicola TaxID=2942208 RepID=A0ABT0PTV8_9FLAO|nr:hypothetical protein [Allomuricauda spongiicola]MCL6274804.1 hypothetical protein [Allomuricauda spongiicola]